MRVFYDTEFHEDGRTIDLVSIGMVAEDGREYDAVSADVDVGRLLARPWLRENVWPSLPHDGLLLDTRDPRVKPRAVIAREVRAFVAATPEPCLWSWYGAYDHVALCQLWGTMHDLPPEVPMWTADLQQEADRLGLGDEDLPRQQTGLHDALADARHHAFLFRWMAERDTSGPGGRQGTGRLSC